MPWQGKAAAANQSRLGFGLALTELAKRDTRVVAISADTLDLIGLRTMMAASPERVIEVGIVRFERGQVAERWGQLINPGCELPPKITEIIYTGYWFSPEMKYLRSFMDEVQEGVTGTARLRLFKGATHIVGRKAPNSLYSRAYATFEEENVYRQADADGFIRLNALRLRLHTLRSEGKLAKADDAILAELADYIE